MNKIWGYIGILVGVFILSDFLIAVGLNSTYKDIERKDNISQVVVYQADATYVNGRIRGIINKPNELDDKYLKIELYSKRDVSLGKQYIEINKEEKTDTQAFEVLFKAKDVRYYTIQLTNEKEQGEEFEILPKEWSKPEILLVVALMFAFFWA